ncbi:MAG: hypothetical protein PVF63_04880 [Gammaproteobacteria bacterium]|jgi:hypothetical protein
MIRIIALISGSFVFAATSFAQSEAVTIPRGTVIFGELQERITSNPRRFKVGRLVPGNVWKDVIVDGHTVIPAGTPMDLRISRVDGSNVGGRGGKLEIMAVSVEAIDGTEISLSGGYDQAGSNRYGLSMALSLVLWPAGFLPGKRAELDVGTVFDASIPADTRIALPDGALPTLTLAALPDLEVEVVYAEINQREGALPLAITLCNREFVRRANITSVNDKAVRPIIVSIITSRRGNPCHQFRGRVNLEDLTTHFSPGINRFSVTMSEAQVDVILNVEM